MLNECCKVFEINVLSVWLNGTFYSLLQRVSVENNKFSVFAYIVQHEYNRYIIAYVMQSLK